MNQQEADTFVFAPFMLAQIECLKTDAAKLALYRAVCQYGCYGIKTKLGNADPTGAMEAMLQGFMSAIDKAKAMRKRNQENGKRSKGAPKGSHNNPNGRRGKVEELTETNPQLTETNQELSYNDYMDSDYMDNELTTTSISLGSTDVEPRLPGADALAAADGDLVLSVEKFIALWSCLPKEYKPRTAIANYIAGARRTKVIAFLHKVSDGKDILAATVAATTLINKYPGSAIKDWRTKGQSHMDNFLNSYQWL